MIYFLQDVCGGAVKIGYSADVPRRRRQLEARYKRPLAVLATMKGGREEEAEIHARFSHIRLKVNAGRGREVEQFRPTAELFNFIGRPLLVGVNPDAVEAMDSKGRVAWKIEASQEWISWLERLAESNGMSAQQFAYFAIAMAARDLGYPEKAPKR